MENQKISQSEDKFSMLVREKIIITILFLMGSIIFYSLTRVDTAGLVLGMSLGTIFAIKFIYNFKYCIYMYLDFKEEPKVGCLKFQDMKTKELGKLMGIVDSYEIEPQVLAKDQWFRGKIWFCVEKNTMENRMIFAVLNWIYGVITSLFFIDSDYRQVAWTILLFKKETCAYRGIFKGQLFKDIYKRGKGDVAEVVYYPRSRLIKELRVCEDVIEKEEITVWHEKNRRYEFIYIECLNPERDADSWLQELIKISEGKKVYFTILSDGKVKGIHRGKVSYHWEDLEQGIYSFQLSKFDENAVTTDIFKNDAVYLTICPPESELTLDDYAKEKDPIIWDIDEGKVCMQIYIANVEEGEIVEITGAPGLKEMETILGKLKEEGIAV
ncbi:hypothetical protein [Dorea sp.]